MGSEPSGIPSVLRSCAPFLCSAAYLGTCVPWKRQVGVSIEASPSTCKSCLCHKGSPCWSRGPSWVGVSTPNPAPYTSCHSHCSTGMRLLRRHFAWCPATENPAKPRKPETLKPLNPAKHEPLRGLWNPVGCSRLLCCCLNMILYLLLHCIFSVTAGGNSCR